MRNTLVPVLGKKHAVSTARTRAAIVCWQRIRQARFYVKGELFLLLAALPP